MFICKQPMCLCNMPGKISICVIINASGKADTMVEYVFVPRGSGLTPVATPVFHLQGPNNGGLLFWACAQKVYYAFYIQQNIRGGIQLIHHIKYWQNIQNKLQIGSRIYKYTLSSLFLFFFLLLSLLFFFFFSFQPQLCLAHSMKKLPDCGNILALWAYFTFCHGFFTGIFTFCHGYFYILPRVQKGYQLRSKILQWKYMT